MRNNRAVTSRSFRDLTSVTGFFFQLADNGTFWHLSDWHDVSDGESGFFAGVDELAGADAFWAHHGFRYFSVFIWVFELDFAERSSPAWVVHDVFDETLHESLSLGVV